jgi:hypothetical protein
MVAWHPHVKAVLKKMELPWRKSHVDTARSVCKNYGFACTVIRKEAHDKQYQYDESGRRLMKTKPDGTKDYDLADADLHMTVSMRPSLTKAVVSGHIYLVQVSCQETGKLIVQQMDNPAEQRSFVRPDLQPVAEEFWLTRAPTYSSTPNANNKQQDSQQHTR